MLFKTLKHKTLPDTYGYGNDNPLEFSHCNTPELKPMTATMEGLKDYYKAYPIAQEQLNDYDLITVEVTPVEDT